jgi:hypothetical protein
VPASQLRAYGMELAGEMPWVRLNPAEATPFGEIFEWPPSEATGLLWLAAMGATGVAEIWGDGLLADWTSGAPRCTGSTTPLSLPTILPHRRYARRARCRRRKLDSAQRGPARAGA